MQEYCYYKNTDYSRLETLVCVKWVFHNNVTGFVCCRTRAGVQDVPSVQDQNEDVNFGRLETLLRRTVLQVRGQTGRKQETGKEGAALIRMKEQAESRKNEEKERQRETNEQHAGENTSAKTISHIT